MTVLSTDICLSMGYIKFLATLIQKRLHIIHQNYMFSRTFTYVGANSILICAERLKYQEHLLHNIVSFQALIWWQQIFLRCVLAYIQQSIQICFAMILGCFVLQFETVETVQLLQTMFFNCLASLSFTSDFHSQFHFLFKVFGLAANLGEWKRPF